MRLKLYIYALFILVGTLALSSDADAACPSGVVVASFNVNQTSFCGPGPHTVSFTNTSTGVTAAGGLYRWYENGVQWDVTNGTGQTPTDVVINGPGVFDFMLVGIDNFNNCIDTTNVTVYVHDTPNASFTFSPDGQCANTTISVNNTSTGADSLTQWWWNFGNGNTSAVQSPTYSYTAGGTYTVTLTQTNAPGCVSTTSTTVTVLDVPVVNIWGDDGDGDLINCLLPADPTTQETVTFFNSSTGAVSYTWDFGDGSPLFTTASTASFTHDYITFGTFTVTMTATHANGCTTVETLTVVFEKYVSSSLTLDITEYSGCAPHTLTTLANLSVNANTYVWDFGDGTPPITTTSFTPPSHTYDAGGTYTITLTASNSCNTATATISPIIIVDGPTASFNTSLPGNLGCAPENVNFTNTSQDVQPANNYYWDMGNGNTYNNQVTPPTQQYDTTGAYTVMLVAGNACGNDTVYQTIQIDTIPIVDLVVTPDTGCTPLTVTSTNNSIGTGMTQNWYVDGFWASNAQTLPPQVFTAPAGNTAVNHTIQLVVSNHCGTDDTTATIVVHPAVVALFTVSDTMICEGESITFTEGSYGDSLTWQWDFGDGTTANTQGAHTNTYNTAGTYTVELIVNGFCGADTMTIDIDVNPIPVADIAPDVNIGCEGLVVNFTNNSTAGGTYVWNFGAGASPATDNTFSPPPVTYNTPGTSMVTLDVDVLGCTAADTVYIDVNPLPTPSFNLTPDDGCTPLDVAFTNTSPNNPGDVYAWDFGNGNTSAAQNPGNEIYTTVLNDTIYTVWLTVTTADGCVDSVSATVDVHPLPNADFSVLPDTACAQEVVAYLNNSTGAGSFLWDFGDGNTTSTISPTHAYANQGNYTVTLVAYSGSSCTDTATAIVVVDSIPAADFNFSIECVGDSTSFTDLSTGGITNWSWNFGDGTPLNTQQSPNHLFAASGTYNVELTVTNPANCTHSIIIPVVVNDVPVAAFTTNPTCFGQTTIFTDQTSGVPVSWEWDFDDGSPIDNNANPTHNFGSVDTFDVTLIVGGGSGCFDTITNQVIVTPIPTSDFTFTSVCANDTTFFASTSTGGPDIYYWDFGNGVTDNTNNPTPSVVYAADGTYNVMLVTGYSASGCTDTIIYAVDAFPRTTPGFTSNVPCLGAPTVFVDTSLNTPNNWTWDFGDASPLDNTASPTHNYATPGFFNVTLVTSNAFNCVDSTQVTIEVYPLPTSQFDFDTVCAGFATTFTDQSLNAVAWEWDFGDASGIDLNPSPIHVFPASGQYNVQLVVTNVEGCTDTLVRIVDVNPNPISAYSVTTACLTYATQFTDNSTAAVGWEWDFDDGSPFDNAVSPSYTYATDGTYNVRLVVTNSFGCTDTSYQTVTVLPIPQAGFINNTVCAGQNVQFTDTTIGTTNFWEWDFGDASPLDNSQSPMHIYNTGGTYSVTFIAGNSAGCYDTLATTIDVFTVPIPEFAADTVCYLNITNFTDQTTDAVAIANWDWNFGDGNTSTDSNPTYIYQNPGTYTVSLVVTNINGCDSTITHDVLVTDVPQAGFWFDTVCVGTPTPFFDTSSGPPTNWFWDFGDGATDNTGPNTNHTYASAGTYLASVIVTGNGAGCTDQAFMIVSVSDNAIAGIVAPDTVCDGTAINFIDNSTIVSGAIVAYTWDFGDGDSAYTMDAPHTYALPGTYTVTHTVESDGGCISTNSQTVEVMPIPVPVFSATTACSNQPTDFTDFSTVGNGVIDSWLWDFGDGNTDIVQNPTHQYGVDGNYNVQLTINTPQGCSASVMQPVTVHPQPTAAFSNDTVCFSDSTTYLDLSTIPNGSIATWDWDFGDGLTSNQANPQHAFAVQNDSFNVTLTVTSAFGCVDSVTQLVTTLPLVDFSFGPEQASGCAPYTLQFNDSSQVLGNGFITAWLWDFDDGNFSFAEDPQHTYDEAGDYFVQLQVTTTNGCVYADVLNYPVTVYPHPDAGFIADHYTVSINQPEVAFTDQSAGALYYEWNFGDGNGDDIPNPIHAYSDTGQYQVMQVVQNEFGCLDTAYSWIFVEGEFTYFVPNAFTPDGDGYNDVFLGVGTGIVDYEFMVLDRWGEVIFKTDDLYEGWDGKKNGVDVEIEVYVWRAKVRDIHNEEHVYVGHVTVVR